MKKYRVIKIIGTGTFGSVVKAQNVETGEIVAIKKMKKKYASWPECLKLREVQCLINLRSGNYTHENVVQLKSIFREFNELHFVFEFMEGDLYQLMVKQKNTGHNFSEDRIRNLMLQTFRGLGYIHKKGYFHRDMKPENLLTKTDPKGGQQIKIADFGLAREIRSRPPFTQYVSTRWYRAPEVLLRSDNYSYPIDMFACGVIMAELYMLRPLFPGKSEFDELQKLCSTLGTPSKSEWAEGIELAKRNGYDFPNFSKTPLDEIVTNASPEALQLMKDLMQWNPRDRPTCQQALNYPYFKNHSSTSSSSSSSSSSISIQKNLFGNPEGSMMKKKKKRKRKNNNEDEVLDEEEDSSLMNDDGDREGEGNSPFISNRKREKERTERRKRRKLRRRRREGSSTSSTTSTSSKTRKSKEGKWGKRVSSKFPSLITPVKEKESTTYNDHNNPIMASPSSASSTTSSSASPISSSSILPSLATKGNGSLPPQYGQQQSPSQQQKMIIKKKRKRQTSSNSVRKRKRIRAKENNDFDGGGSFLPRISSKDLLIGNSIDSSLSSSPITSPNQQQQQQQQQRSSGSGFDDDSFSNSENRKKVRSITNMGGLRKRNKKKNNPSTMVSSSKEFSGMVNNNNNNNSQSQRSYYHHHHHRNRHRNPHNVNKGRKRVIQTKYRFLIKGESELTKSPTGSNHSDSIFNTESTSSSSSMEPKSLIMKKSTSGGRKRMGRLRRYNMMGNNNINNSNNNANSSYLPNTNGYNNINNNPYKMSTFQPTFKKLGINSRF